MKSIGIILAGGNNNRIGRLSDKRAIAALPVAGSYRAIDFTLSNMSNSRVSKVAVLPQFNARSLNIREQQMLFIRTLISLRRAMSLM